MTYPNAHFELGRSRHGTAGKPSRAGPGQDKTGQGRVRCNDRDSGRDNGAAVAGQGSLFLKD